MPVQNLTVSYLDPFLMYEGRWYLDGNLGCALAVANASVSVSFYGTAIYLQGEASVDNYSVVLDGATPVQHNAIGRTIFAQDQLTAAHHTLIINAEAGMTFESMVVTTGDGDSSIQGLDSRIEDDSSNVTYSSSFGKLPNYNVPTASDGNITPVSGECTGQCPQNHFAAYANISFHGNEIALYSWVGLHPTSYVNTTFAQQSGYNVTVDGDPPDYSWPQRGDNIAFLTTTDSYANVNALLYQRSGLATGDHYVVLTPTNPSSTIFFDYAVSRAYPQNDQSPIPTTSQPPSSHTPTIFAIGAPTSAPSMVRSTNVAAIAGGIVGVVVHAFILSTTMIFIIRRRYSQARLTFVGEDGLDGGGGTQPRRSEEDMPPPHYRRIFPSESGAQGDQAQVERELPADAHTPVVGSIARKHPGAGASALDQAASRPSTDPANTALDDAHSRAPIARAILDASLWTWKGVRPLKQRNAAPVQTTLPPGDTGEK